MPSNCSRFCIEFGVQRAFQKLKDKPCEPLNSVDNGHHNSSTEIQQAVGTVVKTYCEAGYRLEGVDTTQCLEFGVWNNPLPFCKDEDTLLVIVLSCCLGAACLLICILICFAIYTYRKYKAYTPIGFNNNDKVEVCAVKTKHAVCHKLNEHAVSANGNVVGVGETNLDAPPTLVQAVPISPRPIPSAPREDDDDDDDDVVKIGPTNEERIPLLETPIVANDLPASPNKQAATTSSSIASSQLLPEGIVTTINAENVVIHQSNTIGDKKEYISERKRVPRIRRNSSNRTKDEAECPHPIEESGVTKLAVQPADLDENKETDSSTDTNGVDDGSSDLLLVRNVTTNSQEESVLENTSAMIGYDFAHCQENSATAAGQKVCVRNTVVDQTDL